MMQIIDRLGARTSGIILLVAGGILGLSAAWIAYGAINRWLTADSLSDWRLDVLARNTEAARQDARDAADSTRDDATAALPAIDLASDTGAKTLETLTARVPSRQRAAVQTVTALAAAMHGAAAGNAQGNDGALIANLLQLAKGGPPTALELSADEPPHLATLAVVLGRRFQAAWATGEVETIRAACGPLLLLEPKSRSAPALRLILAATDPDFPSNAMSTLVSAVPEQGERIALVRQLCRLSSAHAAELLKAIPADKQTAEEQQRMLPGGNQLEPLVQKALAAPAAPGGDLLITRCLSEGRGDLARKLIAQLPAERRQPFELALATAEGDLAALAKLAGDAPELAPRISAITAGAGQFSFQLSTGSGLIPRTEVAVLINGQALPAGRVLRFASAVVVLAELKPGDAYEVRIGDRVVGKGSASP